MIFNTNLSFLISRFSLGIKNILFLVTRKFEDVRSKEKRISTGNKKFERCLIHFTEFLKSANTNKTQLLIKEMKSFSDDRKTKGTGN